jgi:hypothetical protein
MSKRRTIVVTTSATTTSDWYFLDYRYNGESEDRAFFATFASVSNQTLELQVGAWDNDDRDGNPDHTYTVSTYTNLSSTDGVLTGNWPAVRVVLGVNGDAKFVLIG